MTRQNSPEKTRQLIISVSLRLFMEIGYENTSIQDIIDNLGGLSRGAIYHHFKSKSEILVACSDLLYSSQEDIAKEVLSSPDLNSAEMLRKIFSLSISHPSQTQMLSVVPNLLKTPQLIALQISNSIEQTIPQFILPLIKKGVADGSIKTAYPQELAEVFLLLTNLWLNPMIVPATSQNIPRRVEFFSLLLNWAGLDIVDSDVAKKLEEYVALIDTVNSSSK